MNLMELIRSLYGEKEVIEKAIASLEELLQITQPRPRVSSGKRRGRKSMSADERKQVSARIKEYWAAKRKAMGKAAGYTPGA
jgi:hypothetical protein